MQTTLKLLQTNIFVCLYDCAIHSVQVHSLILILSVLTIAVTVSFGLRCPPSNSELLLLASESCPTSQLPSHSSISLSSTIAPCISILRAHSTFNIRIPFTKGKHMLSLIADHTLFSLSIRYRIPPHSNHGLDLLSQYMFFVKMILCQ